MTREQLLRDLANSERKVKNFPKSQNIVTAQSMKSLKSIISSKTMDCGVGTSPPMTRKIDSFDSGVGLVYYSEVPISNHYETLSLKSRKFSIDSECHPDTLAKLNEISKKINTRANSRAPSVKHLSIADEIDLSPSEPAPQKIKPILTDEESDKDQENEPPSKSVRPLATDDERKIRKTWHEARLKKNLSIRSSRTSRKKSRIVELSSDADNETEDDFRKSSFVFFWYIFFENF